MSLDEVEFDDVEENGIFTSSRAAIDDHIGARNLDYKLTVLPPGKVQCPFHCRHGKRKCSSSLSVRASSASARSAFRSAGTTSSPATRRPGGAHQIINTGTTTMRYLSLSTLVEVEACEYPDSGKVLSVAGKRHSGACSVLRMR